MTTKQLADKYNVKPKSVRQAKYMRGHFRGWEVAKYIPHKSGAMIAIWEYIGL